MEPRSQGLSCNRLFEEIPWEQSSFGYYSSEARGTERAAEIEPTPRSNLEKCDKETTRINNKGKC